MKTCPIQKCALVCWLMGMHLFPLWVSAQQLKPIQQALQNEDSVTYYISSGQKLAQEGKYKEALTAFGNARRFDAANEDAILGQMNMNFYLGRIDVGLKVIEDWTRIDPENVKAWKTMADYFSMTGQTEIALNAAGKLIILQPDSASHWELKAGLLMESGNLKDAVKACEKAIALDPKARQAWYIKAYALAGMENFDEAITVCDEAIKLFPDAVEAYYTRACIYSRKGEQENALGDLQTTIEMDPAIKDRAREDPDLKPLYTHASFQKLTGMTKADADEAALADSVCVITDKKYKSRDYMRKIPGSWKADKAYVHGKNLLGERNFYFEFKSNGTMTIKEPVSNFDITGTWKIGENENSLEWVMPDKNNSFKGKYDFLGTHLIISGQGFVGEYEHICLRLKIQ